MMVRKIWKIQFINFFEVWSALTSHTHTLIDANSSISRQKRKNKAIFWRRPCNWQLVGFPNSSSSKSLNWFGLNLAVQTPFSVYMEIPGQCITTKSLQNYCYLDRTFLVTKHVIILTGFVVKITNILIIKQITL